MQTQVKLLSAIVFVALIYNALSDTKKHWKYMEEITFTTNTDTASHSLKQTRNALGTLVVHDFSSVLDASDTMEISGTIK